MTIPRLAPDGVGRGCFMPCVALCGPLYGVLRHWNIETPPDIKTALRACKWHLQRFAIFVLLDTGAKMPPAGLWRAYKRREAAGGYRDMGKRKPAPGKPRAGAGGIQDFFAVSQITMIGSSIINSIIKRGSPPPGLCI